MDCNLVAGLLACAENCRTTVCIALLEMAAGSAMLTKNKIV